jgi:hypothetical protein
MKVSVMNAGIADSLIGKDVRIHRGALPPSALRFMLGDHSEVSLSS